MRRLPRGDARGTALLLVIMLILLLTAVGVAVAVASRTEILIAASFRQGREALYAAEGAVARAVWDLAGLSDWGAVLSGVMTSSFTDGDATTPRTLPGGGTVTLCCGRRSLTGEVQERALGGRSWGADTPQWRIFAWGRVSGWSTGAPIESPFYVAVWVADDPEDGDGDPAVDDNGVIGLYAQALGPGGGRRAIDAILRRPEAAPGEAPPPRVRILSWRVGEW